MKLALVNSQNVIENVIAYDGGNYTPPKDLILQEVNDWVGIGDPIDMPKPPEIPPLDEATKKARRNDAFKSDLTMKGLYFNEKKSDPNLSFSDFLDNLEAMVVQ